MKKLIILSLAVIIGMASCVKDRTTDLNPGAANLGTRQLVHYWNFNNTTDSVALITPSYSAGGAFISYSAASVDDVSPGSTMNARNGDAPGSGLRMRNPYSYLVLHVPTTGYTKPILTFATQRSNSGPTDNLVLYTLDGVNYKSGGIGANSVIIGTDWQVFSIDFSSVAGADNNPNFAIKLLPLNNDTGASGNCRYDNITIDAMQMPPSADTLIHYWNFNTDSAHALTPTFTTGGAMLDYFAPNAYWDTVQTATMLNAVGADVAGAALRLRNPAGTFTLALPTTGYRNVKLSYAVERSSKGPVTNTISYSVDGNTFINDNLDAPSYSVDTLYSIHTVDFSSITAAANNPNFKVRIGLTNMPGADTTKGNDRFDNITLKGQKE